MKLEDNGTEKRTARIHGFDGLDRLSACLDTGLRTKQRSNQ